MIYHYQMKCRVLEKKKYIGRQVVDGTNVSESWNENNFEDKS